MAKTYCPHCGKKVRPSSVQRFCIHCNGLLTPVMSSGEENNQLAGVERVPGFQDAPFHRATEKFGSRWRNTFVGIAGSISLAVGLAGFSFNSRTGHLTSSFAEFFGLYLFAAFLVMAGVLALSIQGRTWKTGLLVSFSILLAILFAFGAESTRRRVAEGGKRSNQVKGATQESPNAYEMALAIKERYKSGEISLDDAALEIDVVLELASPEEIRELFTRGVISDEKAEEFMRKAQ